jgi:hypothetical protein
MCKRILIKLQSIQKKRIIIFLLVSNLFFSLGMTFAYWASSIDGADGLSTGGVDIGTWPIPITTPQEFYDFATKPDSLATDQYYLYQDLDFTGFNWTYNATNNAVIFRGKLLGNGKTISNLSIKNYSSSYLFHGIFPLMEGATVENLTLQDVNLELNATSLGGTSISAGLIVGEVRGSEASYLTQITIIDCGVRGTSTLGVGGLVGRVNQNNTELYITNIKATNLRVFSTARNVGGMIGRINNNAPVSILDIDIEGEFYSDNLNSYSGGVVGYITNNNSPITIKNAVIEMGSQNTLETDPSYYLQYSTRYRGGVIGWHQRTGSLTEIENVIYMGSLYINLNTVRRLDVGTVSGRADVGQVPTITETYYSFVSFRSSSGTVIYTPDGTPTGQMSTLVVDDDYPGTGWWEDFYSLLSFDNPLWLQEPVTQRPYLNLA